MRRTQPQQLSIGGGSKARIIVGVVMVVFALISYVSSKEYNDITGEDQYIALTEEQEIALGEEAVPSLIEEYGGLYQDTEVQAQIDEIGNRLVNESVADDTDWEWEFYVLDSPDVINAFALPGGKVFITTGLLSRFENEDQVAGVLAHEIVHVLARHGAQQVAKSNLTNGVIGAIGVASGDANAQQVAAMVGQLVNLKYGRDDEIQSDTIGVCLMIDADYDPNAMVDVMRILAEASGGQAPPEFFSSHPNPDNRIERIQESIADPSYCPD